MATQFVIANKESILVDDSYRILWADKGKNMPAIPDTIHFVIWNNQPGQNEIQNIDPSTNMMTGNTALNSTGDAVASTTVAALLTWAEERKNQIETAKTTHDSEYDASIAAWCNAAEENTHLNHVWNKTWIDYDSNYS